MKDIQLPKLLDNLYVVHGITGYEAREKNLRKLFDDHHFKYEFVTESADSSENELRIKKYFSPEIKTILKKGPLMCTLVHFMIYERFLESQHKYAIIFENDVCFLDSFTERIQFVINEADLLEEGFIISLENSTLKFPSIRRTRKGKYLYEAETSRCAGAYMIDKKAVRVMLDYLQSHTCNEVIDWWHNHLIENKLIKIYWAHPPLTEQGSFNGKLPSTISTRSEGNLRSLKWSLQKFYKMYILRLVKL